MSKRRKLLSGFVSGSSEEENINKNITQLRLECRFEEAAAQEVIEHDQRLSNQELEDLIEELDGPQSGILKEKKEDAKKRMVKILKTADLTSHRPLYFCSFFAIIKRDLPVLLFTKYSLYI